MSNTRSTTRDIRQARHFIGQVLHQPRFYVFLFLMCIFSCCEIVTICRYLDQQEYKMQLLELVYIVTASGGNMSYLSVLFLLLYHRQSNQDSTRSSIVYCIMSAFMMAFVFTVITALFAIPGTNFGFTWTEPELLESGKLLTSIVPETVYTALSPVQGILCSTTVIFLFWTAASLIIHLFDMFGQSDIGIVLYILAIFSKRIFLYVTYPTYMPDANYTFNTLLASHSGDIQYGMWRISLIYSAIILLLIIISHELSKYKDDASQ